MRIETTSTTRGLRPAWVGVGLLALGCQPFPELSDDGPGSSSATTAGSTPASNGESTESASSMSTGDPGRDSADTSTTGLPSDESDGDSTSGEEQILPGLPFEELEFFAPYETVAGGWGPGNGWGDIDGDGLLDLVIVGGQAPSRVHLNQGDGSFAPWSDDGALAGLDQTVGIAIADYDNDGWADIYVLRHGPNVLLRNLEGQGLADITEVAGVGDAYLGVSGAWGDYDGDSWLDLYVSNAGLQPDILYHANGDGSFSEVSGVMQPPEDYQAFAAAWFDYDNDDDLDLYVVNDKGVGNRLWRNNGPGCRGWCFEDRAPAENAAMEECSMGVAVGDYDGDLDLDLAFTDFEDNHLLRNRVSEGQEGFEDVAEEVGIPPISSGWGVFFFDYDNDGWLDLYVADSRYPDLYTNELYHNLGDGTFEDVTEVSGCNDTGVSLGTSYADYDGDGALDIAVANRHVGHTIYRGRALWPDRHWLTVDLEGGGPINRDAIGARVWITTQSGRTMMQEVKAGSSVASNNMQRLHFGLGIEHIANVQIRWPNGLVEHPKVPREDRVWVHAYPLVDL